VIEAVTLKRFKQFKDERVPLLPSGITLLAGGNNSGKSSILHGLAVWEFCRTVIEAEKGPKALLATGKAQGLGLNLCALRFRSMSALGRIRLTRLFGKTSTLNHPSLTCRSRGED
jgi:predicted ATPase